MPEEIRGLSVKFDADFSEFKKGMRDADKDINSTQKNLKNLQSSLNLKWDSKKFEQAQQQAQKALGATEQKANLLRQRLAAMEAAGVTEKTRDEYNYLEEQLSKTELSAQRLEQQLKQLDDIKVSNLTKGLDTVTSKLKNASNATRGLSTASAAALAGIGALGLNAVKQADEIATLSTQYEMSTDALQRFNYVALQTDTEAETLYKAFTKVRAGIADLATGESSTATKALAQLRLDFKQFDGTEEQFYAIIDSLANMEDQTKMLSLANDIFGERFATNLLPMIYAGTDAINEYREEFETLGALTEEQVSELSDFDNVLNTLKTQYSNVSLQLGSGLLPVMKTFAKVLTEDILPVVKEIVKEIVDWFDGLDEGTQKWMISMLGLLAILSPALRLLSGFSGVISQVIQWLSKMDSATLASYAKWGLLVAAVSTLFAVIANWSKMDTTQRVIALLGALGAAALAAAVAFGVFHSAWSIGLAVAGIVAGITAALAAVQSAADSVGTDVSFDTNSYATAIDVPEYEIPSSGSSGVTTTNNESTYVDNSNIVINIEKNDYMTADDIIREVNRGLKQAKQSRT